MKGLDNMKIRVGVKGFKSSLRNAKILDSRRSFESLFYDDPSYQENAYIWEFTKKKNEDYTLEDKIDLRIWNRKYSNANNITAQFATTWEDGVATGKIIYDKENHNYWIVKDCFNINEIHWQGELTFCNWEIRWQDKITGDIFIYPCYSFNATQYNSGEKPTKNFDLQTSQHMITLPLDENTVRIKTGYRFFMHVEGQDPMPYRVTQIDASTQQGVLRLTVFADTFREGKDNLELRICDYLSEEDFDTTNNDKPLYELESKIDYTSNHIIAGAEGEAFVSKFFDINNEYQSDVIPKWEIIAPFDKSNLEVFESGNQIVISVKRRADSDYTDIVDEQFKLVLTDSYGKYPSELLITIDSLL